MSKTNRKMSGEQPKPSGPEGLGKVTSIEEVKAETLVGDMRDLVLQEMRDAKDGLPWNLRGETQQREMIERADRFARDMIGRVVALCAARGDRNLAGVIKQWRIKDGVQIQIDAHESLENIVSLAEGGRLVRIVFADPSSFGGERAPIRPRPDQKRLFGGDGFDGDDDGPVFDNTPSGGA